MKISDRSGPGPSRADSVWSERIRQALEHYEIALLRSVADKLFKPRSQWPAEELIERCLATLENVAVIDRRLRALEPASRGLLALIGQSRQPRWKLGRLIELMYTLNPDSDTRPVLDLLESGLLYPELGGHGKLKSFEQWIVSAAGGGDLFVFVDPEVAARVEATEVALPECPRVDETVGAVHQADGLDWPLRLAAVWQQVAAAPLRRTQNGSYFKRDLERLRQDPLLNAPAADSLAEAPDKGLLAVELALLLGLLHEQDAELTAGKIPEAWEQGLSATQATFLASLHTLEAWQAGVGLRTREEGHNPYPSAYFAALLLLARLPADAWAAPGVVADIIVARHPEPHWKEDKAEATSRRRGPAPPGPRESIKSFLLGLAYQLGMLQAVKDTQQHWLVRLSPTGRWLLGVAEPPAPPAHFPQTLMVQPNLEIIAYRQGLTPGLIATLSQFATWKSFGPACMLQLQPESVYRALENGQSFTSIRQTLDQHGMRPTPTAVIESLRTWSNKRERIGVYPSTILFEFASADDLNDALARGLPATRLSDCLAVVADEQAIDYRHFRITGNRDYALPPEKCVEVEADGVTLVVDLGRSDLLVETELLRFAEPVDGSKASERKYYRVTPTSLATARDGGLLLADLEQWFLQRTGDALPAAGKLLFTAAQSGSCQLRKETVLHVPSPEIADGIEQWPQTRSFVQQRLGPTALSVAEEELPELRQRLASIGLAIG